MGKFDDIPVFSKFADLTETSMVSKFSDPVELENHPVGTVAWLAKRRIDESRKPCARPLGLSHFYTLRMFRDPSYPISAKIVTKLTPLDLVDHCRQRKSEVTRLGGNVKPQTIMHDITYLRSMVRMFVDLDEFPVEALNVFKKAKRILMREQLIGKSAPRERRPEQFEIDKILDEVDARKRTLIPMRPIVEFSLLAGRRIAETCRLLWEDINHEKKTCIVRDLKNSAGKGFHGEFPLLGRAWDIVMAQPRVTPFIFSMPKKKGMWKQVRSASAGAIYTDIKKVLADRHPGMFKDLRLHDLRAECFTRMFEEGYNVPEVQQLSLHKGDAKTLIKHYTRLRPEMLHQGPAAKRRAA